MSIGKKAAKGFIKLFRRNMLEKLMGLTTVVILARKLSPYDFGLVSISEVLLYTISVFGSTGINEFLLAYRKDDTKQIFKAAFWFNVAVIVLMVIIFLLIAPFWAAYQEDGRIWNISIIIAGVFVSSQLSVIPKAWLSRNLMFDKQVRIQTPFIILIPLAKVAAVFAGWGVYSLVLPTLILSPIQTLVFYVSTKFKPGTNLFTNRWKEIFNFTKHLIGSALLRRLADQGDRFIIGKVLGLGTLGIYSIAMRMAELFTTQLVMISNNILASVLPKYVSDKQKFYNNYINFLKTFSFIILPFLGIMLVAAKPIVLLLYGEKWLAAVLPMQILIVYSALRAVTSSFNVVMNSYHLNKQSFTVNLFFTPTHLTGSYIGASFGLAGVATALVFVRAMFYIWRVRLMMKAVEQPPVKWLKDLSPFFISIAVTIAALWYGSYYMFNVISGIHPLVLIIVTLIAVVLLYNIIIKLFYPKELQKISGFLGVTYPKAQGYFKAVYRV